MSNTERTKRSLNMTMQKLNKARVEEFQRAMAGHVETGEIPGLVTLIGQGDELHIEAAGMKSFGGTSPMTPDTIFRVASITKPIGAAAAMILVDDGMLRLEDSIEPWLPELANRRVLRTIASDPDDTVPAKRAITVRDLLTYTFGFGSVMAMPGTHPIQKLISEWRLGGDGPDYLNKIPDTDEWMRRLGDLPLMHQPGERWLYHTSGDVLGVLVARVAGTTFEGFLRERLFGPLGMEDTSFRVPSPKLDRLPDCYSFDYERNEFQLFDSAADSLWSRPPVFESGAGGLVSTAKDYFAFCRMMLNKGVWKGQRILAESSVEAMTRDQLTQEQRQGSEIFFGDCCSWGYGMSVDTRQDKPWNVPGRFGWDGGFGTSAYSDPTNDFVGILLTQRLMDSPEPPAVFTDFWAKAYQTLES